MRLKRLYIPQCPYIAPGMTPSPKRRKYYLSWQSSLLHFHTDVAHIRLQHQQLYKPILQTGKRGLLSCFTSLPVDIFYEVWDYPTLGSHDSVAHEVNVPFRLSSMFIHKTCWTLRDQPVGSVNCLWPVTRGLLGHMPCQTLKDFPHVLLISPNLNMPIWLLTSTVMWAASMPDEVFKQEKAHLNHLLYSFIWLPESKMYFGVVAWDHAKNVSQKGGFFLQLTISSCFFYKKRLM